MPNDTYPIKINRQWVKPGALYLHPKISRGHMFTYGHVYMLREVSESGMIEYMSSTSPRTVKELTTRYDLQYAPYTHGGGFRRWKQSQFYDWGKEELPGYSLEQFNIGKWRSGKQSEDQKARWQSAIISKLRTKLPTFEEQRDAFVHNLCGSFKSRVDIVRDGWQVSNTLNGACMGPAAYDDYSTPSRDSKISYEFKRLKKHLATKAQT